KFMVLLDYDKAGQEASEKAIDKGVIQENQIKFTICNGSPEAEFEDCLNPAVYADMILEKFGVDINTPQFKGNKKWSDRLKETFLSQGSRWTETVEFKVKFEVANCIPESNEIIRSEDVIIPQKSSFISGLVSAIEIMLEDF